MIVTTYSNYNTTAHKLVYMLSATVAGCIRYGTLITPACIVGVFSSAECMKAMTNIMKTGENMGEATYYLKANGCTKESFEEIKKFFREGCKAEDYWQDHRGVKSGFWIPFEKQFPMVSIYLKHIGMFGGDSNNILDRASRFRFGRKR